jgi:hypothetical protein
VRDLSDDPGQGRIGVACRRGSWLDHEYHGRRDADSGGGRAHHATLAAAEAR